MGHSKNYPEQRGFVKQPDGSYTKVDPFSKQKVVWNFEKGNGERALQHPTHPKIKKDTDFTYE